jgi:hypothetical protein
LKKYEKMVLEKKENLHELQPHIAVVGMVFAHS